MLILEILVAILLAKVIENLFRKPAKRVSQISTEELRTTIISAMLAVDRTREACAEIEAGQTRFMRAYDNRLTDPEEWERVCKIEHDLAESRKSQARVNCEERGGSPAKL